MSEFSYVNLVDESAGARRAGLLTAMDNLKMANVSCAQCPGTCCTFVANSMQVTPIEALDLYNFLRKENRLNDELKAKLNENIAEFRLLSGPHVGAGRAFRRTYTCPFFASKSLGCTISPESKPYGCLAFNAADKQELSGKSCKSDLDELEEREKSMDENSTQSFSKSEDELNALMRKELQIPWIKESIPVALIDLLQRLDS